jgi:hypothetical protein
VVVFVLLGAALWVPTAGAAAPVNDDFADRQVVSGPLPITVQGSNVEATKEGGEFLPGLGAAGHSIWFEWEATATGWVTIGACDDGFPTIVAILVGNGVDKLTPVAAGNAHEGPRCYGQRQYTFRAKSGTRYEIAVDGNRFHMPEAPTPVTEGEVLLRIEPTPPPPNDDFADAAALVAPIEEEPGGSRFYFAGANSYNWTASAEPGEPFFGTTSGASVWYSWTAPETGRYRFGGPCCGTGLNWSLYAGDSLGRLSQVLAATGSAEVSVSAGTAYRIAVYGTPDLETGEPSMASFNFFVAAELPPVFRQPATGPAAAPQPDRVAPRTSLSKRVLQRKPPVVVFRFASDEPGSTFRCSLDRQPFSACGSSRTFSRPGPDRHTLRVYAVDAAGNPDRSPVVAHFRIPSPAHRDRQASG